MVGTNPYKLLFNETPWGEPPPPHPTGKISADVVRLQKVLDRGRHRVPRRVLGKFSASSRHTRPKSYKNLEKMESQTLQNRGPRPPKSSPEPFKTPFLKTSNLRRLLEEVPALGLVAKIANLAPSWRPKTLRNRARNLKKSMLKNHIFLASISEGFGRRFG